MRQAGSMQQFAMCSELVHRYAVAVDTNDMELFGTCFAPDAIYEIDEVFSPSDGPGGPVILRGRDEIVAYVEPVVRGFTESIHSVANLWVHRDQDTEHLTSVSHTIATIKYQDAEGNSRITSRGVRYEGLISRLAERAVYNRCQHIRLWMHHGASLV